MAEGILVEPAYVERLTKALKHELDGADVSHEQLRKERYRFVVVWPGFDGMEHPDRQHIVWEIVDRSLEQSDLIKVSMILTLASEDLPKD